MLLEDTVLRKDDTEVMGVGVRQPEGVHCDTAPVNAPRDRQDWRDLLRLRGVQSLPGSIFCCILVGSSGYPTGLQGYYIYTKSPLASGWRNISQMCQAINKS